MVVLIDVVFCNIVCIFNKLMFFFILQVACIGLLLVVAVFADQPAKRQAFYGAYPAQGNSYSK